MADKFKEHDIVRVVRLTKMSRGVTGALPELGDTGTVVSDSGSLLGMYLVERSDGNGRAVWVAEFDEDELEMDLSEDEAQELLKRSSDKGLELARQLISENDKTAASAIILGTAAGALYWSLQQMPGYEQDSKSWLEAFFRTLTGGLESRGVQLDVQWTRKDS
jgi:2-polyprenyl-6-methoxyphenol hydroxylase-like FAD-dependent oxidoreductase